MDQKLPIQDTFVMLKPDSKARGLIGRIITRFEEKGLEIVAMRMETPERSTVEEHYAEHRGRDYFEPNCNVVCSGDVVLMRVRGQNAIPVTRAMAGATDPEKRVPGTIRGDLSLDMRENLLHTSDSPEAAKRELAVWKI